MTESQTHQDSAKRVVELEEDVLELSKKIEALEDTQQSLLRVIDQLPQAVFWKNRKLVYQGCNRSFARDIGLDMPQMIYGRSNEDLNIPAEIRDPVQKREERVLNMDAPDLHRTERHFSSNGGEAWLDVSRVPLHDTKGRVAGLLVTYEDITHRKIASDELKESGKKYKALFDESRDAMYITTRDGEFLDVNRATLELFGYRHEEIIGKLNVRALYVNPEDRDQFQREIERKGSVTNYPVRFRKSDGKEMDCLLTSNVRRSENGEISGYQGIIRDVTEYRRAVEALREGEARYRAIVEAFDGLIYICSQDYRVEFMNQRFINRTGRDARGELCYRAIHDLDEVCPWCVNQRVFAGETVRWEVLSPKDNRWLYVVNTPIHHTDGSISKQAMILDITDRKKMEEALKEGSEKIKLFAYSVSHDLKSPAIGIHGLTRLLRDNYRHVLDEKGKSYCDQILKGAEQIAALVEQINLYISSKETPLNIEKVDLREIMRMLREEFSIQINIRQIRWIEPESVPRILVDRLAVLRILRNLIDNALKYGGDDMGLIKIGHRETETSHIISVEDDGIGIDETHSEKIFGLFQRDSASSDVSGTGLGLAIVKELTEKHGGEVSMETGPGKGTIFHISLPKKPGDLSIS
jgi:PAS domain S-box-containing protein